MTAKDIISILADKHAEDVFVPECKDGPSMGGSHQRLDAWAMRKSWSHPTTFGYEVKVSRNDFLRDDKWRRYLDLCSKFYFVCPWELIAPNELPAEAGLLWVSKTGSRTFEKKKAPLRETDGRLLEPLFRYVIMCRSRIGAEINEVTTLQHWQQFARQRTEERDLGRCNSKRVAETLRSRVYNVEAENRRLTEENERFADVRATLKELKIDDTWRPAERIREQHKRLTDQFPKGFSWDLEHAANVMTRVAATLKKAENE